MKKIITLLLILCSAVSGSHAQTFNKFLSDTAETGEMEGVISLQDGGYLAYGFQAGDAAYCKVDSSGNLLWKRTAVYNSNFWYQFLTAAVELPTGELMLFYDYTKLSTGASGYLVAKTDANGQNLWTRDLQAGVTNRTISNAILSHDNCVYLAATITGIGGDEEQFIYKLDTSGAVLWNSGFGNYSGTLGGNDFLNFIQLGRDNFIYMMGTRTPVLTGGPYRPVLSKMDSTGTMIWSKTYTLPGASDNPSFWDLLVLPNGNLLIGGTFDNLPTYAGIFILEADTAGNVLWQKQFKDIVNSPYWVTPSSIAIDSSNHIIINGQVKFNNNTHLYTLTTDSTGTILSTKGFTNHYKVGAHYFSNPTHNNNILAYNNSTVSHTYWQLIKHDNQTTFCNQVPYTDLTPFTLPTLTYSTPNIYLHLNNLTSATVPVTIASYTESYDPCTLTGMKDLTDPAILKAYPNPASDEVMLSLAFESTNSITVDIYDINGRKVSAAVAIESSSLRINSSGLLPGMYFVKVWEKDRLAGETKIMIQ